LYSIGIGPETDKAELEVIAGRLSQVFYVDSYDDINLVKNNISLELKECYNPLGEFVEKYSFITILK